MGTDEPGVMFVNVVRSSDQRGQRHDDDLDGQGPQGRAYQDRPRNGRAACSSLRHSTLWCGSLSYADT